MPDREPVTGEGREVGERDAIVGWLRSAVTELVAAGIPEIRLDRPSLVNLADRIEALPVTAVPSHPPGGLPAEREEELREKLHDLWAGKRRADSDLPESYHQAVDESIDAMLELVRAADAAPPSLPAEREDHEHADLPPDLLKALREAPIGTLPGDEKVLELVADWRKRKDREASGGPFTADAKLCDDDGIVRRGQMHHGTDYPCTGHAHLAGEHLRCTSPAHTLDTAPPSLPAERVRVAINSEREVLRGLVGTHTHREMLDRIEAALDAVDTGKAEGQGGGHFGDVEPSHEAQWEHDPQMDRAGLIAWRCHFCDENVWTPDADWSPAALIAKSKAESRGDASDQASLLVRAEQAERHLEQAQADLRVACEMLDAPKPEALSLSREEAEGDWTPLKAMVADLRTVIEESDEKHPMVAARTCLAKLTEGIAALSQVDKEKGDG